MGFGKTVKDFFHSNRSLGHLYDEMIWKKDTIKCALVSDRRYAKQQYEKEIGVKLNLDDPKTFDEKIWYLMLYNRDPLLTKCSDKYEVREYVRECGLEYILNELYGVYDRAEDIDFDTIPSPCFIKCNHTSGGNMIFDRSKPFDREESVRWLNFMLRQNLYCRSREWNYKNIRPRIIVEKLLKDKEGKLPIDYRFMCFNGVPKLIFLDLHACDEEGNHAEDDYRNIYDMDFKPIDMRVTMTPRNPENYGKPENYDEMVRCAEILSKPFPHCRVDLYNIDGTIVFGEMTFYHGAGFNKITPPEWDRKMGDWIDISNIKKPEETGNR